MGCKGRSLYQITKNFLPFFTVKLFTKGIRYFEELSNFLGKVILAKENRQYDRHFERIDSQRQTTFTMESLILAQDER